MRTWLIILTISFISCQSGTDRFIEIPAESGFVSETILTELEVLSESETDSVRLLRQQLYFCEQLDWPIRCESILRTAEEYLGPSDKLIDQKTGYYLKHEDYPKVLQILNGEFETEGRMRKIITSTIGMNQDASELISDYVSKFSEENSSIFIINSYLKSGDTISTRPYFDKVLAENPSHTVLKKYLPILEKENELHKAIYIIERQLDKPDAKDPLQLKRATYYYSLGQIDTSQYMLRELNSTEGNDLLSEQFENTNLWDSALFYVDKNLNNQPENIDLVLRKAFLLESRGWVTRSLPYYQRAYEADTTNLELKSHLDEVSRKVAYLRRKREKETYMPPPIKRRTGN